MNFNFSIFKMSKIDEFQNDSTIKNEKFVVEYMIFFVEKKRKILTFLCKTFKKMINDSNNVFFATTKNKITRKNALKKKHNST